MPNKQSKNFNTYTKKQKDVLDLEKKYFDILFKIFSQQSFKNELRAIMNDINSNWDRVHTLWGKTNVVDLAVERHINFRVYNDPLIKNLIKSFFCKINEVELSSENSTSIVLINLESLLVLSAFNFLKLLIILFLF